MTFEYSEFEYGLIIGLAIGVSVATTPPPFGFLLVLLIAIIGTKVAHYANNAK